MIRIRRRGRRGEEMEWLQDEEDWIEIKKK